MPPDVPDVAEVAHALRVDVGLLVRRLRQLEDRDELSAPETSALSRLDREGPATAAELARREGISPQSMGATLAALEARGLLARRPDEHDGRRRLLTPTDAGRAVLSDRRSARTRRLAEAMEAELSPAELAELAAAVPLLERLARRL